MWKGLEKHPKILKEESTMKFMYPLKPNRISVDSPMFTRCASNPNFILQIKKNGWRILIHKDGDQVEFYSRHKKRMEPIVEDADWDMLRELVRGIKADSCIIDGEFLHRRGEKKNTIYVWDILLLNGELLRKSYKERKQLLESIVTNTDNLSVLEDYVENFQQIWDSLSNPEENEGIVLKDLRERLPVFYSQPSKKSAKQFKILLEDKRNYVGTDLKGI